MSDNTNAYFVNSYTQNKEYWKECHYGRLLRGKPIIALCCAGAFFLIWGIIKIILFESIDIWCFLTSIFCLVIYITVYNLANKLAANMASALPDQNGKLVTEVTDACITLFSPDGEQSKLSYDAVEKCSLTKNYILLYTNEKTVFAFKKDGFSVGSANEFLAFLKEKGIKIK